MSDGAAPAPQPPSPATWARLGPLLDELLDLEPAAREQRLAALRGQDAALAAQLAAWLAQDQALAGADFLQAPALPGLARLAGAAGAGAQAGQRIGAYTLESLIGEGGMGSVWRALRSDGRYQGRVAIKFLRGGLLGAGDAGRFAREGAILAQLDHPHIARLLDAGLADDGQQPYLVLEYVDGEPLDAHVQRRQLDLAATLRLFVDVLDAVAHAHNRLVLHRDLKPSNILVDGQGRIKLLDFGIAKLLDGEGDGQAQAATELTQRAGRAFTPQYAAPEQLAGGALGMATDVYALGVLLYGLLGGGHPTPAATGRTTPLALMQAVLETEPRRLSEAVRARGGADAGRRARALRGDLDTIVAKALKKAPQQRYANAAALAEDLRRWLAHQPIRARPDSAAYVAAKFVRRHRWAVGAGSTALLALGLAVAGALLEGREARRQRDQAEALIEFMLGDLRQRLQPVGRLDVLDVVGEKVLAHYAADAAAGGAQQLDADALARRARALHLLGEIAEKRGRLDEAARRFDEATRSTGLLLAREPANGQRLFDQAQSVYWLGYVARRRGQLDQAEAQFGRYVALTRQLLVLDPQRADWRIEAAMAEQGLGVVQLEAGRAGQALQAFQAALPAFQARAAADPRPETLQSLANAHGWVAGAQRALGDAQAEQAAQQAKVQALLQLPAAQRTPAARHLLAVAWRDLGALALEQGPAGQAAAAQALGEAWQAWQELMALDAANLDWQGQALLTLLDLAQLERARQQLPAAREHLARAQQILPRLLQADAGKLYWQIELRGATLLQAEALGQAGAPELAAFVAELQQRHGDLAALSALRRRVLAEVSLALGRRLAQQGQAAAARPHWQRVLQLLGDAQARRDFRAICLQALALAELGELQLARRLADDIEASAFRHPVYAELRRRLAAPT
ncbi:MAG: serine/threonine protein kinase [Burkholderiaceae bacterium]|nr:serine/threonine protein kinase [Burkholderiaceae bacterium]